MNNTQLSSPNPQDNCPDILRWIPNRWDLFIGNVMLKRHLKKLVRHIRKLIQEDRVHDLNRLCFLLTGESRTGKTAMISFFVRCITCNEPDNESLNPCDGRCEACKQEPEVYGDAGLFVQLRESKTVVPIHLKLIDASMIEGPADLRVQVRELRDFDGIRVVYIDEVHRLVRREMDEILLKAIEQKGFFWIFSTAKPQGLEDMFVNRLIKVSTELPDEEEMETWLTDRCDEWGISWEPEAIQRVVEKSNRIVGTALHALALAAIEPDPGLTSELVEQWKISVE